MPNQWKHARLSERINYLPNKDYWGGHRKDQPE